MTYGCAQNALRSQYPTCSSAAPAAWAQGKWKLALQPLKQQPTVAPAKVQWVQRRWPARDLARAKAQMTPRSSPVSELHDAQCT